MQSTLYDCGRRRTKLNNDKQKRTKSYKDEQKSNKDGRTCVVGLSMEKNSKFSAMNLSSHEICLRGLEFGMHVLIDTFV